MIEPPLTLAPDQLFWICAALFIFVFFLIAFTIWKRRRLPYYSASHLLTRGEGVFYHALRQAVPDSFHITYKVRLGDVVRCSDRLWDKGFGKKISSQHLDFVVVDLHSGQIKLVIELDDKSHDNPHVKRRDHWKNRVLKTAGLPIMRVRAKYKYDTRSLQRQFWAVLRSRDEIYIRERRQRLSK